MIWWNLAPWVIGGMFIGGMSLVVFGSWGLITEKVGNDVD